MKPWEKRLHDLSRLLQNCHSTYLDPDLFRMNTNQFLQTARTVTFIIQKNKGAIPDYANWYSSKVTEPWGKSDVMRWAKDARNTIEKEGDLELHSTLNLTLIFSYLEEDDIEINCGRNELLNANVNKLIRLARHYLPSGISDAAAVKIERRWISNMLPDWELLHALHYVYARMFECCQSLALQIDNALDEIIQSPDNYESARDERRQVSYIKFNGLHHHTIATKTLKIDYKFDLPQELRETFSQIQEDLTSPTNLEETVNYYSKMAELTFNHFGNHDQMLFLLNDRWQPVDLVTTAFADQADKFIFWRHVAERIVILNVACIVWISESWVRVVDQDKIVAIRDMAVAGEQLHVVAVDTSGNKKEVCWQIERALPALKPRLEQTDPIDLLKDQRFPYFLYPALRAMGVSDPELKPAHSTHAFELPRAI
jgi:hypothetical protein